MKRLIHYLQTVSGATSGEVIVVGTLIGGLLLGHGLRWIQRWTDPQLTPPTSAAEIARLLDSLAGPPIVAPAVEPIDTLVPRPSIPKPASRTTGIVHLNTASKTRLMTLPGVGEATAERIIQHRMRSPFRRPEDIMHVKGIGEKRFERMRPFIAVP
jgi:competence ComEA-like helix-hairpin-helix protein